MMAGRAGRRQVSRQRTGARGNLCGSGISAASDAAEMALWRLMSFYELPLADLDTALQADPGWARCHAS